jgi:hypothetical protein
MPKLRHLIAFFLLMSLFCVWCATARDVAHGNSAKTDLDLVSMGKGKTKSGHRTAIRVYEAPDGTKGQIVYTEFDHCWPRSSRLKSGFKRHERSRAESKIRAKAVS